MAKVSVNENPVFEGLVRSVMITDGKVYINDVDMTPQMEKISIQIIGNVGSINADICNSITITGDAGSVATQSGHVTAKNVAGDVRSMSGSIDCLEITGNASTMSGSIFRK